MRLSGRAAPRVQAGADEAPDRPRARTPPTRRGASRWSLASSSAITATPATSAATAIAAARGTVSGCVVGSHHPEWSQAAERVGSRRPSRSTSAGQDVGHRPQRLLDVDVGDAGDLEREQRHPRGLAGSRRGRARARRTARRPGPRRRPRRAGRPGRRRRTRRSPSCSPRVRRAQPELALDAVGVERPHRHAGLHHRDRQRVVEHRARAEAAALQPLERERLDRRAVLVGVEPDVAEEDAVGLRHRPAGAASTACGAAEAVGEHAQPLAQLRRAAAASAPSSVSSWRRSSGNSSAISGSIQRHRQRLDAASPAPPRRAARTTCPHDLAAAARERDRRADRHRVGVGDRAVVVVADRHPPPALAHQRGARRRGRRAPRPPRSRRRGSAGARARARRSGARSGPSGWRRTRARPGPRSASWHELRTSLPAHLARLVRVDLRVALELRVARAGPRTAAASRRSGTPREPGASVPSVLSVM